MHHVTLPSMGILILLLLLGALFVPPSPLDVTKIRLRRNFSQQRSRSLLMFLARKKCIDSTLINTDLLPSICQHLDYGDGCTKKTRAIIDNRALRGRFEATYSSSLSYRSLKRFSSPSCWGVHGPNTRAPVILEPNLAAHVQNYGTKRSLWHCTNAIELH
jgi:hypothetical protein